MKHTVEFQVQWIGKLEELTTVKLLKLIRESSNAKMIVRKDGINYHFEADFLRSII